MIVQNCNVELTKVHYYDDDRRGRNVQIATISRDEPRKYVRKNTVIKKNIFGHKWVLKINESNENLKKSRTKLVVYVLVFACIVIAVCFGIFLSIESSYLFKTSKKQVPISVTNSSIHRDKPVYNNSTNDTTFHNSTSNPKESIKLHNTTTKGTNDTSNKFCRNCSLKEEVCLKLLEIGTPKCVKIIDRKDPTGCGGLCKINKEYCKLLDEEELLFQCMKLQNTLNCSESFFNCGNRCISSKMRCDGFFHCSDQSDERNCDCDLTTHFQCGNTTGCLDKSKKCDGKVDCWDNSDEVKCNRTCNNSQVACHNGQCVSQEDFCDGTYHCLDKSDEPKGCELQK